MLPFLQPKKLAASILAKRNSDGNSDGQDHKEDEAHPELKSAAEDMISAVHAKDSEALAAAMLKANEHLNPEESEE